MAAPPEEGPRGPAYREAVVARSTRPGLGCRPRPGTEERGLEMRTTRRSIRSAGRAGTGAAVALLVLAFVFPGSARGAGRGPALPPKVKPALAPPTGNGP